MGNYNVTQSFEFGYRFRTVGGDLGMYRSVENYGNGLRLLGSHLTVNSQGRPRPSLRRNPAQHAWASATTRTRP